MAGFPRPGARYWVAQAKGANFPDLHRLGFSSLYPAADDYAFLEVDPRRRSLTTAGRERALGLEFLRSPGSRELLELGAEQLLPMVGAVGTPGVGVRVDIVRGYAEGLSGTVIERGEGEDMEVLAEAFSGRYPVRVRTDEVVVAGSVDQGT